MKGNFFKLSPGEMIQWDYRRKGGPLTWIPGTPLPSHSSSAVTIVGVGPGQIAKALKESNGIAVYGSFEYVNVFNEYCCEGFVLNWNPTDGFSFQPSGLRDVACAKTIPNICRLEGEPPAPK
jgi:hypothetical protein